MVVFCLNVTIKAGSSPRFQNPENPATLPREMETLYEATLVWPLVAGNAREQDTHTHTYRVQVDMQSTLAEIQAAATGVMQFFAIRAVTYTTNARGQGGELRATLTVAIHKESPDYKGPRDTRGAKHMVNMLPLYFNDDAEAGRKALRSTAHDVGLRLGEAMLEALDEQVDAEEDSEASAEQTPVYESLETVEYRETEDSDSKVVYCPQHLECDTSEYMHSMQCGPPSKRRRMADKTDDQDDEWIYV